MRLLAVRLNDMMRVVRLWMRLFCSSIFDSLMNVVWVCGGTTMIDGEVAAVGMVSYCFEGVNDYAPIGFAAGWCTVFLGALLCSVKSGPTRTALSFPVLASGVMLKVTRVPTGGILFPKPMQALGMTNMSSSLSVLMKPNLLLSLIAFMTPVMSGNPVFFSLPSCWKFGLAFSCADFACLRESGVSE